MLLFLTIMNIIIVSFELAPSSGVGGRRWRKFSKELHRRGHNIHILTADDKEHIYSQTSDLEGIQLYSIPRGLGLRPGSSLAARILYKLRGGYATRYFHYIDPFEPWAQRATKRASEIMRDRHIDVLIASGHPCSVNLYLGRSKREFPKVLFVQDFRDLWNHEVNYQVGYISKKAKKRSLEWERIVMEEADMVIALSRSQGEKLKECHPCVASKLGIFYNGYDPEDVTLSGPQGQQSRIRLTHAGSIRWSGLLAFQSFLDVLMEWPSEKLDQLEIIFYGANPVTYCRPDQVNFMNDKIAFKGLVAEDVLNREILAKKKSMGLVFFDKVTALGTKIFNYMACDRPAMIVAPKGELTELAEENELPWAEAEKASVQVALDKVLDFDFDSWSWKTRKQDYRTDKIASNIEVMLEKYRRVGNS